MMLYLCMLCVSLLMHGIESLSFCTPVDSIFLLHSELIVQDQNADSIEEFFKSLIYEATSELSGIGLFAFDVVPEGFSNPILGLTETLGANTGNSMNVISSTLNFGRLGFYSASSMNTIELSDAIAAAHELFVAESAGRELEALFILDVQDDVLDQTEICQNAIDTLSPSSMESVYYLQMGDMFEIQEIYDCVNQTEVRDFDALTDLYETTCPSEYGSVKFDKKVQGIELGSVISCDLVPVFSECKQSFELSSESTITVHDDLEDDMSYEIGYILMATKKVEAFLPKECTVPVLKIVDITEVSVETATDNDGDDRWERVLRLNVVMPELFDYVSGAHVEETDDDAPCMKPDEDLVDPEEIQKARKMIIKERRRRLFFGSFIASVASSLLPNAVGSPFLTDAGDILDAGVDLIKECLPNFNFELPSFNIGCDKSGCEFTLPIITIDETFTTSGSASGSGMTATGTGTIDVDASVIVYVKLGVHLYGPDFRARFGIPPVEISDLGAKLYGKFRFTVQATAVGSGQLEFNWDGVYKYLTRKPIVMWAGPVPIVLWPKIGVGLEGELNSILEITADYKYVYEADWELGARIRSSGVSLIKKFTDKTTTVDNTNFNAIEALSIAPSCPTKMTFKLGMPIKIGVEFYLAIYPHLILTPAIEGEVIIPYAGCYNDGGCTSSGYPTGILIDSKITLDVDAGLRASALGFTVACIFDQPASTEFGLFEATIYNLPAKKICNRNGFVALPLWKSCCGSGAAALSCTSWPSYSGTNEQRCDAGNAKNDGYFYVYNRDLGTSSAACGQASNCWCCRMKEGQEPAWWRTGDAYFRLKNKATKSCMTDLWYSGCSGSSNQYWRLSHLTTYRGYFRVTNKQTGKCLVNRNSGYYSKPDGWNWDSITPVGNFADQFWYLYRETGEYFMIRSK
eukprot:810232_1